MKKIILLFLSIIISSLFFLVQADNYNKINQSHGDSSLSILQNVLLRDSLLIKKYKKHISSLDYIARQTDNNKYFLNLANNYADSILLLDAINVFAFEIQKKIKLTLLTCELNMNHKFELFPFFKGVPDYLGFVDDPIEYAYDDALSKLLSSRFFMVNDKNLTSIIVRESCDDEMFEIVNQILIKNTKHYILPFYKIEDILGSIEALKIKNGVIKESSMLKICNQLGLDRLGIFNVNDVDLIDNSIWLVESKFNTFKKNEGFSDYFITRAFNLDKRHISLFDILLHILGSIFLISIISFFDQKKKLIKIFNDKSTSVFRNYFELFINKFRFILSCFTIPFILSFVMIYTVSNLTPNSESHYFEVSSLLWIVSLTLVMSIIPTVINLLFINRLDLDGFHSINGYRYFFNTSLYASYFPVFVFFTVHFEYFPHYEHLILILITLVIADLLARSYYQFTAKSIHKNLKKQSIFGLFLGFFSLMFFNVLILSEIVILNFLIALAVIVPIAIMYFYIGKRLDYFNEKKLSESEDVTLIEGIFINNVLDPNKIYDRINKYLSSSDLNIMTISAPMGIGKTTILNQVKKKFKTSGWEWYYGDCDEIQGENAISFEPFIEAFSKLLKVTEFSKRFDSIESQKSNISSVINMTGLNTDLISDFKRDSQKPMTEICIDIIDKLEALDKKMVFVMEDLHWIDPESYAFLKHFIDITNNNKFLRGNLCIILTVRECLDSNYRGVDTKMLIADLESLESDNTNKFKLDTLLHTSEFNLYDFIKNLSDQNNSDNKFKIQSSSMFQINSIFNAKLEDNSVYNKNLVDKENSAVLTPLYVLKVLESWINKEILKYSPDGYFLTQTINSESLPNASEVDGHYHSIFELFEPKWQRLLESAAIIGQKFDAEILAKVWGYELLDILAFLEKAVEHQLLIDLSQEDNFYEFKDKRIISAIKSFFLSNTDDTNDKQIVIEYNKRYIATQQDIILNPSLYPVENLLKVARRLSTLKSGDKYKSQLHDLIREIAIRFIISNDFDKLQAFSKYLLSKNIKNISFILNVLSIVSNPDHDSDIQIIEIQKLYNPNNNNDEKSLKILPNDDFEKELIFICCLYFEYNTKNNILEIKDFNFLTALAKNKYQEKVLFYLSLHLIHFRIEQNKLINYHELFLKYDSLLDSLQNSEDYYLFNNIIEIEKLNRKRSSFISRNLNNTTWSEKYIKPTREGLKNEYSNLYDKLIEFNNLDLLASLLKNYLNYLSNSLSQKSNAIELYLKSINLLKDSKRLDVSLKMFISRLHCGELLVSKHEKIAKDNFNSINSFFQKRFNINTFNDFVNEYLDYKKKYFISTRNYIELEKLTRNLINRYKKHKGEESYEYSTACEYYADALNFNGKPDEHIKWIEKTITIRELLIKKTGHNKGLIHLYHNLVFHLIKFKPKDHKKILLFSQNSLELANSKGLSYWESLWGHAIALAHTNNFQDSFNYFNNSIDYLMSINIENKEKIISNIKLNLALVYSRINLKKSFKMLKDAVLEAKNPDFLLIFEAKESGKSQNWELISFAEKILKENNQL